MRRSGIGVLAGHAGRLVFFLLVFLHWSIFSGSQGSAAETPLATYKCQWPDPRLGSGLVLKLFAGARATLTFEGVVVAGEQDPESEYAYSEDGTTLELSPRSESARQIGTVRYARSDDRLTFVGNNGSLSCSKG